MVTCVYNPRSRGFDLTARRGNPGLDTLLAAIGQPLGVNQQGHWRYYIPEIYWADLFRMLEACYFKVSQELQGFWAEYDHPYWGIPTTPFPLVTSGGTELRPYQIPAVEKLLKGSLILGDDMGLGKTVSTIQAWLYIQSRMPTTLMVVTPNEDVAGDWLECIETHFKGSDIRPLLITDRKDLKRIEQANLILIPYSKVWRTGYFQALLSVIERCILCCDEAHKLSRAESQQHQGCYSLAVRARAVWCLTGTEVSNLPDQYYGMYRLVRQPRFDKYVVKPNGLSDKAWVQYYRNPYDRNSWHTQRLDNLKTVRQAFALRRTKEEVQKDLPPLTKLRLPCVLDPVTAKIYKDLERDCEAELQRQGNPEVLSEDHFWVIYLRLIQLCSHPILLGEERVPVPNKWYRLESVIEECSGSQRIGIWSNFPTTIEWIADRIRTHYPWLTVATAHGSVNKKERAEIKLAVKAGEVDVLIANPAIWSEGVNLQAISCGFYWDYHPSLVRWKQSGGRFHRMGQTKAVTQYEPYYVGSVEKKLLDWLEQKGRLSEMITG